MASHAEIETSKTIAGKTVTPTLDNDGFRAVPFHDISDRRFKDALVRNVIDPIAKREIYRIIFAISNSDVTKFTGPREVLAVFMERYGHDTICRVEGLLHAVSMMDINVDIQHPLSKA